MAEEEGVAGLEGCAFGFLEVGLRLLVFGGSGFAVFVLLLHEIEGGAGGCQGCITANALLLGSKGVVVGLLDFFVEILLGFFELELLVGYLQTGLAHCIAGGIAVEDGDGQGHTKGLVEVVVDLLAKRGGGNARGLVVIATHAGGKWTEG